MLIVNMEARCSDAFFRVLGICRTKRSIPSSMTKERGCFASFYLKSNRGAQWRHFTSRRSS
ncbi:hypothetical protein [Bacteroides fluxus]|uniref:hypothetical protein n=1 Tax=Bacteroides fluxus TaxID=626930 RepID=UPI002A7F2CDE|nr:hypothetical protein [Bacteroides fluxus]MDY3789104.1 hypothetical protein [Bacteroides fluxus]